MLVRPTNRPGNEATLDASWRIKDADSAVHPASYFARSAQPLGTRARARSAQRVAPNLSGLARARAPSTHVRRS